MESDDKITPTSPEPSELSELSENSDNSEPSELSVPKKRRPLWIRILKWTGITLLSLVLLIIILYRREGVMGMREFSWNGFFGFFRRLGKKEEKA